MDWPEEDGPEATPEEILPPKKETPDDREQANLTLIASLIEGRKVQFRHNLRQVGDAFDTVAQLLSHNSCNNELQEDARKNAGRFQRADRLLDLFDAFGAVKASDILALSGEDQFGAYTETRARFMKEILTHVTELTT